jgi:hypothetical protein
VQVHETFSMFENFVPLTGTGVPAYARSNYYAASHLLLLMKNALARMHILP